MKRAQMWIVISSLVAVVAVWMGFSLWSKATATTSTATHTSEPRYIEVDAFSKIDAVPNLVDLNLRLQVERATPKQATQELLQKRTALVEALKKAGLPSSSLTMSHLNLYVRYKRYGQEIRGYEASVSLVACIQKMERLSEFVEVAAKEGVSGFSTQFRSSDVVSIKQKLRDMALHAARAKAQQIAKTMKLRLGQVRFIKEVQASFSNYYTLTNSYSGGRLRRGQSNVQPGAIPMQFSIRVSFMIQ